MPILRIKNFGPIGENEQDKDGFFTVQIAPVTVFIGETASGKSTAAKLCSIFSWLEKKLKIDSSINLNIEAFKNLCSQQEIKDYFLPNTALIYEGDAFIFEYDERVKIIASEDRTNISDYVLPKIQYVSAARNLLTILYAIQNSKIISGNGTVIDFSSNIPFMVKDLNTEYIRALNGFGKGGFKLPIKNTKVFYKDHYTFIEADKKRIAMSAASSGIQSMTPLLMVSKLLSDEVQKDLFEKLKNTSEDLKNKIRADLQKKHDGLVEKFNLYCMGGKQILKHDADIETLETIIKKYVPSYFINIVEEPEQNLFPETQANVLYTLLEYKNISRDTKLIFSTHSPYILTALNNAIFAYEVFTKTGTTISQLPKSRMLPFENVAAYTFENGRVRSIIDKKTHLIDAAQIDNCSIKINDTFDTLLEILNEQTEN